MTDNVIKMNKKTGKIPSSVIDEMNKNYKDYVVLALNEEGEFSFSINSDSHGNVFQMLILAGGHIYNDQFQ
jgi:hypothetical protein